MIVDEWMHLEEVEAQVLADLEAALGAHDRAHLGLTVKHVHGATMMLMARYAPIQEFNRVIGVGLQGPVTDAVLSDLRSAARDGDVANIMIGLHPRAQPSDLPQRLLDAGATPARAWVQMVRGANAMDVPGTFAIHEVDEENIDAFMNVFARGFGMPPDLQALAVATIGRFGWRHFLAFEEDVPVGCASLYQREEYAWLGNATTLPERRGRGVQSALIAFRVREAARSGARWVFTEVAEDLPNKPNPSEHNMRRAGFTVAYRREHFVLSTA
ncbi:GNAT family N-acetyltransferase [Deinococcus yavapaiensis]|uniref:Acetyltransferase (GNAT) family protein n=1 Tax=Deinococcus yavapaiensis KR-236 TaxID=694435 RepID=A0A318S4Y9_9DEIO|nr:GNAT family N-acetyltransferase [Deinococcus yavapaiensis]PYE50533.1 acetyltransferase (GNAT) family protein [Deinococcus yavapaiensis KR-236]